MPIPVIPPSPRPGVPAGRPSLAALLLLLTWQGCDSGTEKPAAAGPPPRSLAELLLPPPAPPPVTAKGKRLCQALTLSRHLGEPGVAERLRRLAALGPGAAPPLVALLGRGPAHARMGAAVLLGAPCAHPCALRPLCLALEDGERQVAIAAAYALADMGRAAAAPALLLAVIDPGRRRDPGVRAAAAAALVRLGSPRGVPLLLAILRAALPGAEEWERRFGLPRKDRWALEKEIALHTLRRLAGRRLGYEPEMGWAGMEKKAAAWSRWWEQEGRRAFPPAGPALDRVLAATVAALQEQGESLPPPEAARARTLLAALR